MIFKYDLINREERAICSHLFRLLHENLDKKWDSPLGLFLTKLKDRNPENLFLNGIVSSTNFENVGIFAEVSLIRDYYDFLKQKDELQPFMNNIVKLIMDQEDIDECKLYSELDSPLNEPKKTHPKQIKYKARDKAITLSRTEKKVYGSLQGMFNAKPDLVIVINDYLLTFEAKFTLPFEEEQLTRTRNITEVWSKLLYNELGFKQPPVVEVFKLGADRFEPHISWSDVFDIAKITYPKTDRSFIALESGLELIK